MKCNALLAKYVNFGIDKDERTEAVVEVQCRRCKSLNEMNLRGAKTTCLIA